MMSVNPGSDGEIEMNPLDECEHKLELNPL
jgi:hypothetical protein